MLDKNSSVVEVELLARSENLVGKIPSKIGSKVSLILQPGDVSLLEKKEFLGVNYKNLFPRNWVKHFYFIMFGQTIPLSE